MLSGPKSVNRKALVWSSLALGYASAHYPADISAVSLRVSKMLQDHGYSSHLCLREAMEMAPFVGAH